MKTWMRTAAAVMLILFLAGCSAPEAASIEERPDGSGAAADPAGSVYWLNADPEADGAIRSVASLYEELTGVSVRVSTPEMGAYQEVLREQMDGTRPPSLFVITSQNALDEWQDRALDLTGTPIASECTSDVFLLRGENGRIAAAGYAFEAFGIVVNMDLLAKAGHHVSDIRDFATLAAIVQDIHVRSRELGFDAFTSNPLGLSSSWRYTGHLANLVYYYQQHGTMWTSAPPQITDEYLPNYHDLYDLIINNSMAAPAHLTDGGHDPISEFCAGEAAFCLDGGWSWDEIRGIVPHATLIPYYCGVSGEENAGMNCGTQGRNWAVNAEVSEADQQATLDFMEWCVTDPEASAILVDAFGAMPYRQAAAPVNDLLGAAHQYTLDGRYVMNWAYLLQPEPDLYREGLVEALTKYVQDQSAVNWQLFTEAFVGGWAEFYRAEQQ
ncbi:MAG: carbohydrate ABC transporter substrate-binding protein [Clostridia bacterium]|nr:carbohydrate ABC transporter substrate-binding protein [Clostridia bacterium]